MMSPECITAPRPTYPQDWPNYNLAQQNEKDMFLVLLRDLCSTVDQPPQTVGRPRLPLADMLFAVVFKTYSGLSARRFTSDVREAQKRGLIDHAQHFNLTNRYLADPDLTETLKALIELSAEPLAAVESAIAIDSTGFGTTTYRRWFDHKWGKEKAEQRWVKCHLVCGVETNIVAAALVTANESADSPQLPELLKRTLKRFGVEEVSGDKAYSSKANIRAIVEAGATPYIPFRAYSKGRRQRKGRQDSLWEKAYHFYSYNRDEFDAHYHKRSNVEATVAMIKGKMGASVKSKTPAAQVNEVLCKILCHNLCVLIQSFYELGIESSFGTPTVVAAPQVINLNRYRNRVWRRK